MLIRHLPTWLLLPSILAVAACNGTGGFTSDLDPDATIDSLTDQQAADLCVALFEHYDSVHGDDTTARSFCRLSAAMESDEAACDEHYETCIESTPFDIRAACELNITAARERCTATVAEIEACGDATVELYADALALSCAEAPLENAIARFGASPEACATLPGSCNSLVLQSGR